MGAIFHTDKHWCPIHFSVPGQVIALAGRRRKPDLPGGEVFVHHLEKLLFDERVVRRPLARAMKRRGPVAFPVVNLAAGMRAHAGVSGLESSAGCIRHQVAMALPTMVWMNALNTARTAASGVAEMF